MLFRHTKVEITQVPNLRLLMRTPEDVRKIHETCLLTLVRTDVGNLDLFSYGRDPKIL